MDNFPEMHIWHQHRVSYGETDAMGVLYYAEYLHIFERSRNTFIRERGFSYKEVEAKGFFLPVREAQCRYRSPARYDDTLYVKTGISEWGRASMTFAYELHDAAKSRILATGITQHACVNAAGRPVAIPQWLKNLIISKD